MGALPRLVEMSCAIVHSLLGAVCAQKQILAATASTFGPQAGTFGPGGPSQVHHAAALLLSLTATHFVKTRISRRDWAKLPVKTGKPFSPPLSLLPAPSSPFLLVLFVLVLLPTPFPSRRDHVFSEPTLQQCLEFP